MYNWLSLTGFILAVNSLLLILVLFLFSLFSTQGNSYLGLYIYIILPVFLGLGLLLIPLGIILRIRKKDSDIENQDIWPLFDLNKRTERARFFKISIITLLIIVTSAIGTFRAYKYTESVEFCGKLCHEVEEPEYVTYLHSPHARVTCVECHVSEGTNWYVKSKLSGLYQIYSVLFKKYSRPVTTPIHALRPVRETCEHCHWPEKFYGRKLISQRSYLTDSANTDWYTSVVLKVGPEFDSIGTTEGIHWHINKNYLTEYAASSSDREHIPWVKLTDLRTGKVKIFVDEENPLSKQTLDTIKIRSMDCMDCHNRASHLFLSPTTYINKAMVAGKIPKDIPFIKKAAMEALKNPFTSMDTAMISIDRIVLDFYKEKHPAMYASEIKRIKAAITVIKEEYKNNAFPYMRADASSFPNHIGHIESDGCFRCHSGRHKTATGETISRNCDLCHSINAQGRTGKLEESTVNRPLDYKHPTDIREKWKTVFCSECHRVLYN
jgi:nitrate/TMAO reductase-like tetraheme cytochrome c subunit